MSPKNPTTTKKPSREPGPISPAKAAAIAKATAASRAALGGISPRTAGIERTKKALVWVYRWGWTTTALLDIAVGSGVAARMILAGLLVKTPTVSAGIDGTPSHFLTLSRLGLEHATQLSDVELPYKLNAARVPQGTLNHHETVQRLTVVRDKLFGDLSSFSTENELRHSGNLTPTDKIPDAAWNVFNDTLFNDTNGIYRFAVEIELSPKWKQELDTFVYQSLLQLARKTYDGILIFSHSDALLARYKTAFEPGTRLQTWTRPAGAWIRGSTVQIPPRASGVVQFRLISPEILGKTTRPATAPGAQFDNFETLNDTIDGYKWVM